jgi:thioredoxin 1
MNALLRQARAKDPMSQRIFNVTDASLEADVLQSTGWVLVDFWAPWCGPCKMLAPLLDELAEEYKDQLRIAKINADDNKESGERCAVRGLPTLVLFHNGVERERVLGMTTKSRLAALIDKHLEA